MPPLLRRRPQDLENLIGRHGVRHPQLRRLPERNFIFGLGEGALGRGGRYYQNLTLEGERQLLQGFLAQSETGGILEVSRVKAAYEQVLGRKVPKSTIYRMLARHGWRKVVPRCRHTMAQF